MCWSLRSDLSPTSVLNYAAILVPEWNNILKKNLSKTAMYQIKAFLFKSRNFTRSHTPFPGVKQPLIKSVKVIYWLCELVTTHDKWRNSHHEVDDSDMTVLESDSIHISCTFCHETYNSMRGWQFSIKMNFEFLSGPLNYSVRPEWHKQRQLCSTYHMMSEHFQNILHDA